jgi:hypothetical protein
MTRRLSMHVAGRMFGERCVNRDWLDQRHGNRRSFFLKHQPVVSRSPRQPTAHVFAYT